jgi:hypothetical protein
LLAFVITSEVFKLPKYYNDFLPSYIFIINVIVVVHNKSF